MPAISASYRAMRPCASMMSAHHIPMQQRRWRALLAGLGVTLLVSGCWSHRALVPGDTNRRIGDVRFEGSDLDVSELRMKLALRLIVYPQMQEQVV